MADLYAIDTNVYIRALRDTAELRRLKQFLRRAGTRLHVHAVVAMELRAGARTEAHRDALDELIAAYAERRRVVVPSFDGFVQAGRVLADLAAHEHVALATAPRSLQNDVLIATSCREHGVRLVTDNHADFAAIRRHLRGFTFDDPWPLM